MKAVRYGMACFFHMRIEGRAIVKKKMMEWVGPLCSRPGISRSMSAMIEVVNNRGMFVLTFRGLEVAFAVMYPNAM